MEIPPLCRVAVSSCLPMAEEVEGMLRVAEATTTEAVVVAVAQVALEELVPLKAAGLAATQI